MNNKKLKNVFIVVVICVILIFIIYAIYIFYWLKTTEIKVGKDYYSFIVEPNVCADYSVFENPGKKYEVLDYLDINTRKEIANYMKEYHLQLRNGKQEFKRIDYTFEELVHTDFMFEPIYDNIGIIQWHKRRPCDLFTENNKLWSVRSNRKY